jgi:hypothetical protein
MQSRRAFISTGRLVAYIVVALIVGGVYFGFKWYTGKAEEIDDPMAAPTPAALSKYLAEQHRSTSVNPGSLPLADASRMSDTFADWLGTRKTLEDLVGEKPTIKFLGARPSKVPIPQAGKSVQLLFSTDPNGGAGATASLFLKTYMLTDQSTIPQDASQSLPGGGPGLDSTLIWHKGGLLYILVGPKEPLEALKIGTGCPSPGGEYKGE